MCRILPGLVSILNSLNNTIAALTMKTLFKIWAVTTLLFTSCQHSDEALFWIAAPEGQENDLLFLAESSNIPAIPSERLPFYLTKDELVGAENKIFKDFGKIYSNAQFSVHILLQQDSSLSRAYTFMVRTMDKSSHIIDSQVLGAWIEPEHLYCFGSIDQNLIIKKKCEGEDHPVVFQILEDGKIVVSSFLRAE